MLPNAGRRVPPARRESSDLGYDTNFTSTEGASPAALGNRIAQTCIQYGLTDGANEDLNYGDPTWMPVNEPMIVDLPGTARLAALRPRS